MSDALTLLDRDGLEALNMRGLAKHLGVTPMALYNHVSNKEDLLHGIAATVIDQLQFECDSDDWWEQIRACFRELRQACLAHPGLVRLVETAEVLPASIFRPMELTLAALQRAGIGPEDALRAYFLLTNFTIGQVSYQIRGPFRGVDPTEAMRHGRLPAVTFPASAAAVEPAALRGWDFEAAFEFGLTVILSGLTCVARPSGTGEQRPE
ncbi:TetR/AcrR family transcriptional regulator [Microvirga ossetica]|uniref:TetR/AcrR family transcriptional regulator n=1 Tax=Microvirga ossetica TaxID=1882682 RepID=UPI00138FF5CB|nr:TetR/AcrR family transcriptional regulator [Microvirga ossetica]